MTKFAPLALVPARSPARAAPARFVVAFVLTAAVVSIPIFLFGGTLRDFWDATLGYQADRASPFSVYGLWGGLDWLHTLVQVGGGRAGDRGRVRAAPQRPRRRRRAGGRGARSPCSSSLTYWFFLYIAWIAPLVFIALLCREGEPAI